MAAQSETWKEDTAKEAINRLQNDVFPMIGERAIVDVDAPRLLDVLRLVEKRGVVDMAARLGQLCSQIFRFAIAKGLIKYNPVPDMRGALKPRARAIMPQSGPMTCPPSWWLCKGMRPKCTCRLLSNVFVRIARLPTNFPTWCYLIFE
ncbi:tyrosine-type recombinase/integrase [Massilia atriviolacea]|uniref:tyrosine-type recombinase/integrase n=1 Tax=Massilia atriviolacea TaxID=2495579 RepID=UPI00385773B3